MCDMESTVSVKNSTKLEGFQFWKETLSAARHVVAPMVDQSELAWRILSRRHNAHLCYTPMLHSSVFNRDPAYRRDNLATCEADRPLIVQFCGNDVNMVVKAGLLSQHMCDAIDINLGCPQSIAKRGHYGAFLQEEWQLLKEMVAECHAKWSVPITAKIRIFTSIAKTVEYAKMLEEAGVQLLTVHGRTREQKGPMTGLASWPHIQAVREAVDIPVFANGNIQYLTDAERCIEATGVQGVMIAEGSLHNPALFDGVNPVVWDMVEEYLQLATQYPCNLTYVRGHMFKMCIHSFTVYNEWRMTLGECKSLDKIKLVMKEFMEVLKADEQKHRENPETFDFGSLKYPYWICQPYVRPDANAKLDEPSDAKRLKVLSDEMLKSALPDYLQRLSKKKLRKALQKPHKPMSNIQTPGRGKFEMCLECKSNARGLKCEKQCCKVCCRKLCRELSSNCSAHNLYYKKSTVRRKEEEVQVDETVCST